MNIGYIRVSTTEQVNQGHSLYGQEDKIKNYSVLEGLKNIEVFKDEGYSAGSDKRPSYKKITNLIKKGKVNNLIITKVDRISRNIVDFNNLINLCLEYDVNLVSIEDSLNLSTAMGRCMANIIMSMAQMEREQISERTILGVEAGLKKGYYSLGGILPIGIKRTKDNKLKYTPEIEIVKYMFKLDKQGYSYVNIKEKVLSKYNCDLKSKNKVEEIIKNELYRGYRTYNGNKYYFLKPIVKDEYEKEDIKQVIRKRNIKTHSYLFEKFE